MGEFFLNERSLRGQYTDRLNFLSALRRILECRDLIETTGHVLYSDARIQFRPSIQQSSFESSVRACGRKELISVVLAWLSRTGPFWTASPQHSTRDLFECLNEDVTDASLAEAACRHCETAPCRALSFIPSTMQVHPLRVTWMREAGGEVDVFLDNYWDAADLRKLLTVAPSPPTTWEELWNGIKDSYPHLLFSEGAMGPLTAEAFSRAAADEIRLLLGVLNEISSCHDVETNQLNSRGLELWNLFFQGHHARFSDENPRPKFNFKHPLTGLVTSCSWHGKIRLGLQYRIHFKWPKPKGESLWVSYIGPKLSKW